MSKTKKIILWSVIGVVGVILLLALVFLCIYASRLSTVSSIAKITSYNDGFDIYTMDVKYDYSIEDIISHGIENNQDVFDAIMQESLPLLPVNIQAPSFGCSAFGMTTTDGTHLMGRNYDFKKNTSAMLVYCSPKNYYKSVAFAALNNLSADQPLSSTTKKLATLAAPFVCLDGINEKGVSIAVLVVDSDPVFQQTDKDAIFTTLAIRLVLDRAATTDEAVELLKGYDMFASSGKDYHFYVNDAQGNGKVIEWDCENPTRELVATPVDVVTNFYTIYADKVLPDQKNGIYGHGKERYNYIKQVFAEQEGNLTNKTAWDALKAASQDPSETDITSNTQWSIVFDNTNLTAEIVLRRNWNDVHKFSVFGN